MEEHTATDLEDRAYEIDQAVAITPDVDRFCSSSLWILPAWKAFLPEHRLWAMEGAEGFILLAIGEDKSLGTYVHPLEASWALANPFIGPNAAELTREFIDLSRRTEQPWDILFLSGIRPDSPHFHELLRGFRGHFSLGLGPSSVRRIASLEGGLDGFLGRRSSKFRHNLRRSRRRAEDTGITVEFIAAPSLEECIPLFDRALEIEQRSWKANLDTGIINSPMTAFYRDMLPRLVQRKALRFLFLTLDGVDIAYCFGAVFDHDFRGLQMSFDDSYRAHSPGSLAQLAIIDALAAEGVQNYDLGSDMEYKRDWAEESLETLAIVVRQI